MIKNGICKVVTFFTILLFVCAFFKVPAIADEIGESTITEGTDNGESEEGKETEEDIIYHTLSIYDKDGITELRDPYKIEASSTPLYLNELYSLENAEKYGSSKQELCRLLNGYEVLKWEVYTKKTDSDEYTYQKIMSWYDIINNSQSKYNLSKYDVKFIAVYSSYPAEYPINYVLNKGTISDSAPTYMTYDSKIKLTKPTRKGYVFDGWYLSSDYSESSKITTLTSANCKDINYDDNLEIPAISVYAKWKNVTPSTVTISKLSNSSSGKVTVTIKKPASAPAGYELQFSTDKNFKTNVRTVELKADTKFTVDSLTKNKKYYFRIRAYNKDSLKNQIYCSYSKVKSIKITKGETEVAPSSSSATLKSVKITGKNTKLVTVTATVSKRVSSKDDYYYLVKVDPFTGAYVSTVASSPKSSSLSIKVPLTDAKGTNLYAAKFAIAVKSSDKNYTIISSSSYIDNPSSAASYTGKFPTPASKKGRQGTYTYEDGDKQYFMNFNINSIISSKAAGGQPYKYNGKTYYFKFNNTYLDTIVSNVNKDGGTVTFQIMLTYDNQFKNLIKSTARSITNKPYYAFNVEEAVSRNQIEAAFYALAEHYSQPDRHVDNWILGNEVNTFKNPIGYYWAGSISNDQFIANYSQTFRILYYAVVSNSKNSRVYTCVDHTFNDRGYEWGVKNFTAYFNQAIKSLNPNIKWNLAYHAYSAVLTNADFWNDNSADIYTTSRDYYTDFISPLNIEVLVQYVRDHFGDVRIILSEQAFSSTGGNNAAVNGGRASGEDVQAAAVAYLYYKVQFNPYIDSVIFSHPNDNLGPGMDFALKPTAKNVYKYMDTPAYASYTSSCVKTITGSDSATWNSLISSFNDSVLKSMPSRK